MRFRLVPKSKTMGDKRHYCRKKSYEAHQKIMNEERPILSATKCRPMALFSRNIKYRGRPMQIFKGFPQAGASNTRNCPFSYPSLIRRPRSLCSLWNFAVKLTVRKL